MFYTYKDRDRDLQKRNLLIAGGLTVGLVGLLSNKGRREFIGRSLVSFTGNAFSKLEAGLYKNSLTNIREGFKDVSKIMSIGFRGTELERKFASFDRLLGIDIPRHNVRETAVDILTNKFSWSEKDARLLLNQSNRSFDILSSTPLSKSLEHGYYRDHILPQLSESVTSDREKMFSQLSITLHQARVAKHLTNPEAYRKANEIFAQHLGNISGQKSNPLFGFFGIKNNRLGDFTHQELFEHIGQAFKSEEVSTALGGNKFFEARNRAFDIVSKSMLETHKHNLTEADILALKASIALKSAGKDWQPIVKNLTTNFISTDTNVLNTRSISNLIGAGREVLSREFQIPIAPGLGGIKPLSLFPWKRGQSIDYAGTIGAGSKQRELYEILKDKISFNEDKSLKHDLYFLGNKLFGIKSDEFSEDIVNISGNFDVRNANHGFFKAFSRIRNNQDIAQGNIRSLIGDNFLGKTMDYLGLDRQEEPSKLSKLFSIFAKNRYIEDEAFRGHPLNSFNRILGGSNSPKDIQSVLRAIRNQNVIPNNFDIRSIFTDDVLKEAQLHPGFTKLVKGGFKDEDLTIALREIDAVMGREDLDSWQFFNKEDKVSTFKSAFTKITARRFVQDDVGTLAHSIGDFDSRDLFNLEGIGGGSNNRTGFSRIRDLFFDELIEQVSVSPRRGSLFNKLLGNISALDIDHTVRESLLGNIWSLGQERYLGSSFLQEAERATHIADLIRDTSDPLHDIIKNNINNKYGRLTSWLNPVNLEDIGHSLYVMPEGRSIEQGIFHGIKESIHNRSIRPLGNILRETSSNQGVNAGFLYHSGLRLNQMLEDYGLGLPDRDLQTAGSIYGNLFIKRFLPVFAGIEAIKYVNYEMHQDIGWGPDEGIANIRARTALGGSFIADKLGITSSLKHLSDLTPGLERYYQPRTFEEQKQYLLEGQEAVRRGRGWLTGSRGAFTGDRVSYFLPSWYQQAQSRWQETDLADLNSEDYWKHSLLPTPRHPFSPIKHFIDPYWWENKHKEDRPFLVSGEMADPNTIWGSIINATIGKILKPRKILHPEYLPENEVTVGSVNQSTENTYVKFNNTGGYELIRNIYGNKLGVGGFGLGGSLSDNIKSSFGTFSKVEGFVPLAGAQGTQRTYEDFSYPSNLKSIATKTTRQLEDIYGIYGFLNRTQLESLGIKIEDNDPVIQSPQRAYGWERRFYDKNIGGIGGILNELARRVLPHRNRNQEEINPVHNQMPSWIPGDDYFINFKRGDYSKIPYGEIRLPGEAYESVHDNKNYDAITRAEILGGVAPWSAEYKVAIAQAREQIAGINNPELLKEQKQRLKDILKRASIQKKLQDFHDYRFNIPTERQQVTIDKFIDPNTILTKEDSEHPIRLSGVRLSKQRIQEYLSNQNIRVQKGQTIIEAFYSSFGIEKGDTITAYLSKRENGQISDDLLKTKRADIFAHGINLNKTFLDNGVGIEKEGENTGPGIMSRYGRRDRFVGNLIEKFVHLDTPFHNKIFPTRSSLESYKRSQVYGTIAGDWAAPYSTYVKPTMDAIASRNLVFSGLTGAFIGSLFGISKESKIIGAKIGAAIGASMSVRRILGEHASGEKYIPDRVRKRRELEEYYDTLKFIKNKRLEKYYSDQALEKEKVNVSDLIVEQQKRGEAFKRKRDDIQEQKRSLIISDLPEDYRNKRLSALNRNLNKLIEDNKKEFSVGPLTAKALYYRQQSSKTLYGARPGEPLDDVMSAIPRYEREMIMDVVLKGTGKEKKELYSLLSNRQKSVLGYQLGIKSNQIPDKERLLDYFRNHTLPDESWKGWAENTNLNDYRAVSSKEEGINPIEIGIYPKNLNDAEISTRDNPVPVVSGKSDNIRNTLHTLLQGKGITDLNISVTVEPSNYSHSTIDLDLQHDRTQEVANRVFV